MAADRLRGALTLGIVLTTALAFGQSGTSGSVREKTTAPADAEGHVNAGFVLGTGVRWQDSALYGERHRPGLDLLRSGRFIDAVAWFEKQVQATPEDLFMNRGLYEASALSRAPSEARNFYAARAKKAEEEHRVVGPIETLGAAALIGLGVYEPSKGLIFDRIHAFETDMAVVGRLYQDVDSLSAERSTALWCATTWRALGYTGPARKVLRGFLARVPDDMAARYTLARFYALGEVPADGAWNDNPLRADSFPNSASALKEAEIILSRSPEFYPALWIAGTSAINLGDRMKARKYLARYVAVGGTKYKPDAERILKSL